MKSKIRDLAQRFGSLIICMLKNKKGARMPKKLFCTVTKNFTYCSDSRYASLIARFGSEAELKAKYVSRAGVKMLEQDIHPSNRNMIFCTVTGQACFISAKRMTRLMAKHNQTEEQVRANYVSRIAKRLRKEGKTDDEIKAIVKGQ